MRLEVQKTENSSLKTEPIPESESLTDSKTLQEHLRTTLYELAGDDEHELVNELIQVFLSNGTTLTANLAAAITEQNPAKLEQVAHGLKSNSASFGATTLANLCEQLEQLGRAGDTTGADKVVPRVLSEYALVSHQLSLLRSDVQNQNGSQNSSLMVEETENALARLVPEIKNTLTDFIGEEPEIIRDLVQTYREDAKQLIESLREAIDQGDAAALAQAAHSLKSSSGNLGASRLAALSFSLEKKGKVVDLTNAPAKFAQLEVEYNLVEAALDQICGSLSEIMQVPGAMESKL